MDNQQHLLLVITSYDEQVIADIKPILDLARAQGARLSLLFTIPQIPSYYYKLPSMAVFRDALIRRAEDYLLKLGRWLEIADEDLWIEIGHLKTVITKTAQKLGANLTLIASEGDRQANARKPIMEIAA